MAHAYAAVDSNQRLPGKSSLTGRRDLRDLALGRPANGESLVEWAYGALKDLILRGCLPPGFRALEMELTQHFMISRTPMREALLRLQADGLVELTPRRGVRVLPLSAADVREIYQLLICLEGTAAELVALRGLDSASPEVIELTDANERMRAALDADDLSLWACMDERFHRLLIDHCGNGRLKRLVETVWDQSHRARMLTMSYRPRPVHSFDEHRAVIEAIVRGDSRVANEIHSAHRRRAMKLFLTLIETHQLGNL